MFAPELVTAPAALPVSLDEMKAALRVDGSDFDSELTSLIKAAVAHYDGWTGILGIGLVEQTWRQDFARFDRDMCLPLRYVSAISSVKWRDADGQIGTVASDRYALKIDGGGRARVRFVDSYSAPSSLYQVAPVSVEYVIGWPLDDDDHPTTPEDIKTAIKLRVQMLFDHAAQDASEALERIERSLVAKYRAPIF